MIFKSSFNRAQNIGEFEIFYEAFDSLVFSKCKCQFLNPMISRDNALHMNEPATCNLYNNLDNSVISIHLTNDEALSICESRKGLSLLFDKFIIIPSYDKYETRCVNLMTNEVLWKSPINKLRQIFIYKDRIYIEWSSSSGGLSIISAESGKILDNIFKYKIDNSTLTGIVVDRLNDRFLLAYNNGYLFAIDMQTSNVSFLKIRFEVNSKFYNLAGIVRDQNLHAVKLRFKDFITSGPLYLGGQAEWVFSDIVLNVDSLFDMAVPNPFGKNIPTNKECLKKSFIEIWGE